MAFTYDPTTDEGKIRLNIGDTDSDAAQFQDNEISAFLTTYGDVLAASIAAARALAAKYSRRADISVESVSKRYGQIAANYLSLATALEIQGSKDGTSSAGPSATGISIAEIDAADANADRPASQNVEGMFDNKDGIGRRNAQRDRW